MTEPTEKPESQPEPAYSEFTETVKLTPEEETARKRRNLVIAFGLVAFCVLIAVTTMVRMSSNYSSGL